MTFFVIAFLMINVYEVQGEAKDGFISRGYCDATKAR